MVKQSGQRPPGPPAGVPDDPRHRTANAVHSAALRMLRSVRTVDDALDLDGPRASLLSVLVYAGPQPVSRLAAIEQVSPPAITKLVTALEGVGLVTRERAGRDRRVVLVTATPAGRDLIEAGRAARVRAVAEMLAGLSDRDLGTLRRAAAILASRLGDGR